MTPLLDELRRAAIAARQEEEAFRRDWASRLAALERSRAFAVRRLDLMGEIAAAAQAPEREVALTGGLAVLRARLGWHEDVAGAARRTVLEAFTPVIAALHAAVHPAEAGAEGAEAAPSSAAADPVAPPDPAAALAAFEAWYAAERGLPFWELFDVELPETPRIDF